MNHHKKQYVRADLIESKPHPPAAMPDAGNTEKATEKAEEVQSALNLETKPIDRIQSGGSAPIYDENGLRNDPD